MDLQTLIEGKFDPVGAIRLLAYRVALLEAREEHSVVEGMPEEPQVQSVAERAVVGTDADDVADGEKGTPAQKSAPVELATGGDVDAAAATGAGGDAAGASEGPAKKGAPAKAASGKKKASA